MSDNQPFSVLRIQPEWVLEPEQMGSKQKFWYIEPGEGKTAWLFKYPKPGTGMHWSEKVAAALANKMRILHAPVELALFEEEKGSTTESFAREGRSLYHGNQILAGAVDGYDQAATFRHSSHTLEVIFGALDQRFSTPEGAKRAKGQFAEYLVLDALIGNVDRHHENWGFLVKKTGNNEWQGRLAPSFDHASSMGRELVDEKRRQFLRENRVRSYADRGHGAIYWDAAEKKGPSPLELVRRALPVYPDFFKPALEKIRMVTPADFDQIVSCVPGEWMTPTTREFTLALLRNNHTQLLALLVP